jgi:hypothetical protein
MAEDRSQSPISTDAWYAKLAAETRKVIQKSRELLQHRLPDTFLGRETHKPFPENSKK